MAQRPFHYQPPQPFYSYPYYSYPQRPPQRRIHPKTPFPAAPVADGLFFTCKWDNCNALFRKFDELSKHVSEHLEFVRMHNSKTFGSPDNAFGPPALSPAPAPAPTPAPKMLEKPDHVVSDEPCNICESAIGVAGNDIILCDSCGTAYHQKCHHPPIPNHNHETAWLCAECSAAIAT